MHKPLFLITAGSVAAVGALVVASALPAGAATSVRAETMARIQPAPGPDPSAYTSVTFTITTTGNLAISAPTTLQHLDGDSTTNAGGTIGAAGISNFGAVTVTDGRDDAASTWTATVASTDFTTPGTAGNVIPVDDATYVTNGVSSVSGQGFTATDIADATSSTTAPTYTAAPITLANTGKTIVTETGFDGDNAATWAPTIIVAVPADALTGVYTGTVTHSVS